MMPSTPAAQSEFERKMLLAWRVIKCESSSSKVTKPLLMFGARVYLRQLDPVYIVIRKS
jgi:hypothetical protein